MTETEVYDFDLVSVTLTPCLCVTLTLCLFVTLTLSLCDLDLVSQCIQGVAPSMTETGMNDLDHVCV